MSAGLDEAQAEAVEARGPVLVIACPGAGKTRTLAARAARILADPGARVAAVSFTRDAAREIRERILAAAPGAGDRVAAGTFHSLCYRQLGGSREPVVSREEQLAYAARAAREARCDLEPEDALAVIEAWRSGGRLEAPGVDGEALAAAYGEILRRNGKIDFQDLIGRALEGLRRGAVKPLAATHLLLDEFQDADESQLAWALEHARAGAEVTAVGDDDQCHPPGTRIATERGWTPVERLAPGRLAIAAFDAGRFRPFATRRYRLARLPFVGCLVRVRALGGGSVLCTPEHRWWARGPAGGAFLVEARHLAPGAMEIPAVDEKGRAAWRGVASVEKLPYAGEVWGLTVPGAGLYVAEGLVTHNSIYGWRRALGHEGMERFAQAVRARRLALGVNYRSRSEIVERASRLVERNRGRIPKRLRAHRGGGGSVETREYPSPELEALAAAEAARAARGSFAALARTNRRLDALEAAFAALGVPYVRQGSDSVLDREEARVLADLLRLAAGGGGEGIDHALAWAGAPEDDLRALAAAFGGRLVRPSRQALAGLPVSRPGAELWRSLMSRAAGWHRAAQAGAAALVVEAAASWMEEHLPDKRAGANLEHAKAFFSRREGDLEERLRLFGRLRREKPAPGASVLATMHAAKGLEWDEVWIAAAEEGVAPDDKAPLEEERRLFYVAMTRARDRLFISHTARRPPSRFLFELDDPA